jgi:hypothetical protein
MTGRTAARGVLLLCALALLALPVAANYAGGDLAVTAHGRVTGDVILSPGDSRYSGELGPGGTYTVTFAPALPEGATVRNATVFLAYTWSHAGTIGVRPEIAAGAGGIPVSSARSYADRKGAGQYDYPSGLLVYDVAEQYQPGTPIAFTVTNVATSAGVAFSGAVLLIAYDGPGGGAEYWDAEGAEMLYATGEVSPTSATARIHFDAVPTVPAGGSAALISVVPEGNRGLNTLTVNGREFPGLFDGRPYADLTINTTDVGPILIAGENTVTLRDEGDYLVPGVFVLVLRGAGGAAPPAPTRGSPPSTIGALAAVGLVTVVALQRRGTGPASWRPNHYMKTSHRSRDNR